MPTDTREVEAVAMTDKEEPKFYVSRNKKIAGPFSVQQIETRITAGRLKLNDKFSTDKSYFSKTLQDFYVNENELPHTIKRSLFFGSKTRVEYTCPRCEGRIWNYLSEAGDDDECPVCRTKFSVPGVAELAQFGSKSKTQKSKSLSSSEDESDRSLEKGYGVFSWGLADFFWALVALAFVSVIGYPFYILATAIFPILSELGSLAEFFGLEGVPIWKMFVGAGVMALFVPFALPFSLPLLWLIVLLFVDTNEAIRNPGKSSTIGELYWQFFLWCWGVGGILILLGLVSIPLGWIFG